LTAPALWRLTCLAAKALRAAIMPVQMPQRQSVPILKRHLIEPPRKRCYQAIPTLCQRVCGFAGGYLLLKAFSLLLPNPKQNNWNVCMLFPTQPNFAHLVNEFTYQSSLAVAQSEQLNGQVATSVLLDDCWQSTFQLFTLLES
jgi:hypothetical protein